VDIVRAMGSPSGTLRGGDQAAPKARGRCYPVESIRVRPKHLAKAGDLHWEIAFLDGKTWPGRIDQPCLDVGTLLRAPFQWRRVADPTTGSGAKRTRPGDIAVSGGVA
jgi:hypothetical protein